MALRRVMAAVAGIGEDALDLAAEGVFHCGDDRFERVSIVRIAGKATACRANWPPFERVSVVATETLTPNS
jgi:hypothetical protein